jgi:hypothetical protein
MLDGSSLDFVFHLVVLVLLELDDRGPVRGLNVVTTPEIDGVEKFHQVDVQTIGFLS